MNYKTKDDAAYHTFWLMLRNNGIATHGKCTNKNINNDLMQTYKKEIKLWKYNASSKEVNVRQSLQSLVQDTLAELRSCTGVLGERGRERERGEGPPGPDLSTSWLAEPWCRRRTSAQGRVGQFPTGLNHMIGLPRC